jgi:hypothetical protein
MRPARCRGAGACFMLIAAEHAHLSGRSLVTAESCLTAKVALEPGACAKWGFVGCQRPGVDQIAECVILLATRRLPRRLIPERGLTLRAPVGSGRRRRQ